jgi:branched-chain amino acid aminotransferase
VSQGLRLRTATFTRYHANSLFRRAKANANYMNSMIALREAESVGADDVLLLDEDGYVTETSAANVFLVEGGALYAPPREAALNGITRNTVMRLAAMAGLTVSERRLSRDDFYVADEAFVTGTAVEVTPIRELDGRRIGAGARGKITERLQSMYAAYVRGRGETDLGWLTWVSER